jgi:hypothetical protein
MLKSLKGSHLVIVWYRTALDPKVVSLSIPATASNRLFEVEPHPRDNGCAASPNTVDGLNSELGRAALQLGVDVESGVDVEFKVPALAQGFVEEEVGWFCATCACHKDARFWYSSQ